MEMRTDSAGRAEVSWDLLIRVSGIALFALLIIAYTTGEEYPHTHRMIGYGMAVLLAVGIFWLAVRPHDGRLLPINYSPRLITARLRNADGLARTLMSLFFVLAALPLCALIMILVTHTLWGTTWIDEMHEVVAYFVIGLVAFYSAIVGIASIQYIDERLRRLFRMGKHP
jgi:hypothetical protein